MILDPNDPTGLGLFSKCARNHASKSKAQHSSITNRPKTKNRREEPSLKKSIIHVGFSKQQSRQQRQKKYHKQQAPPVGQYNPLIKQKPKLVWDILRAFHRNLKPKTNSAVALPQHKTHHLSEIESEPSLAPVEPQSSSMDQSHKQNNLRTSITADQSSIISGNRNQCIVNMSRMTGRKEENFESVDWGQSNVMQSVGYVKGKLSKNIYFQKLPSDQKKRYDTLNYSASYNCNYRFVKPTPKGLVNFSTVRGRQKTIKTDYSYSYEHYNYEQYVWDSDSKVFPSTKTHLIPFEKQASRYSHRKQSKF